MKRCEDDRYFKKQGGPVCDGHSRAGRGEETEESRESGLLFLKNEKENEEKNANRGKNLSTQTRAPEHQGAVKLPVVGMNPFLIFSSTLVSGIKHGVCNTALYTICRNAAHRGWM